mgnify:CR=1 FL=1
MVTYKCNNCGYITNRKSNYNQHLNRKKTCKNEILYDTSSSESIQKLIVDKAVYNDNHNIIISENSAKIDDNENKIHECSKCLKSFTCYQNRWRHEQKCKQTDNEMYEKLVSKLDSFTETQRIKDEEFKKKEEQWDTERKELYKMIENVAKDNAKTINNTLNQNIIINSHGEEDLKYITGDYLTELLKIPYNSVPTLVKQIHFHPHHPENQNIKITNKKLPYIQVFKNNQWQLKDKREVIGNIVDCSVRILGEHLEEYETLNPQQKYRFNEFKTKYDENNKNLEKKLVKDTELCLINNTPILDKV